MNPNRSIPRCFVIKMEEVKEMILKTTGEKVNYKGNPHEFISWFLYRNAAGQKGVEKYNQSIEREKSAT